MQATESFVSLKIAAEKKIHGDDVGKETNFKVAPHLIKIKPGFNRPISREKVDSFKTAIRAGAVIPPVFLEVDVGTINMVDGEHRHIAVTELIAEGMEIPFMSAIHFRGGEADQIAHMLGSASGNPISPLDQGFQFMKLLALKWDVKTMADRTGYSVQHVNECLTLAGANGDVHDAIRNNHIASTEAVKIVRTKGSKAGAVIAEHLEVAKAQGKSKVTAKTIKGDAPTKTLPDAIQAEIDSGGTFRAETLCPRYAHLIAYLRNEQQVKRIAEAVKAA